MPFNYAITPKLAKAEAVTQWQFQNVFCTLKKAACLKQRSCCRFLHSRN